MSHTIIITTKVESFKDQIVKFASGFGAFATIEEKTAEPKMPADKKITQEQSNIICDLLEKDWKNIRQIEILMGMSAYEIMLNLPIMTVRPQLKSSIISVFSEFVLGLQKSELEDLSAIYPDTVVCTLTQLLITNNQCTTIMQEAIMIVLENIKTHRSENVESIVSKLMATIWRSELSAKLKLQCSRIYISAI